MKQPCRLMARSRRANMSAQWSLTGGKADVARISLNRRNDPKRTLRKWQLRLPDRHLAGKVTSLKPGAGHEAAYVYFAGRRRCGERPFIRSARADNNVPPSQLPRAASGRGHHFNEAADGTAE